MVNFFKKYIYVRLFKFLYFLGLTLILPYIFLVKPTFEIKFLKPTFILIAAISLILVGVFGVYSNKKSWKKTFFSLGLLTFIPGIIALLIAIYSEEIILALFKSSMINLKQLKPLIDMYLVKKVPRLWIITIFYIVLGIIMFLAGRRAKR